MYSTCSFWCLCNLSIFVRLSGKGGRSFEEKKKMYVWSMKHVRPEWVQIFKCYCISNHFCIFNQLSLPLSFCQKEKLFEASQNFFWPCGYKEAKLPMWNIAYKSKLQPSVSIFWGIYRRQNFEVQCRYGTKEWHHRLNWNDWMGMRHSCNIKIQWRFLVIHWTYMIVFLHFLGCLGCCLWKFHSAEHC